ncbi:MAG: hydroxymethylbilane synthase [Planctomycetes bacterium]|nr:hydroxymethylbilane synthase [Planctomycetota bacterium]
MSARKRIGTRGSDLALWQARYVAEALRAQGCETEIVVLKTKGDLIDDVPLRQVEGKAFFTAEIERALLTHEVDVAVHSHKDLPTEMTRGLAIAAVPARAACHERLLAREECVDRAAAFLPLRRGAVVGTSAPRRAEQLRTLRPDLRVEELRGNVPTRVRKLREGRYDAIVLAAAGLDRLELSVEGLFAHDLEVALFVPAPAQGALAVQVRSDDAEMMALCRAALHDAATARAIEAERALLVGAGGGCSLPLAAAVSAEGAQFRAHGFLGAGHPAIAAHGRWAEARAASPEAAIDAVLRALRHGEATGSGPLGGLRVALAGSAQDGSQLGERLLELGASVRAERVIALENLPGVDLFGFLAAAKAGDVIAVTSRHAARSLAGMKIAPGVRFAAVGKASARELLGAGFAADWVGESGARELACSLELERGSRVFWPCAAEALPDFGAELRARGIELRSLAVYRTLECEDVALTPDVDARVYMSPSAVRAALVWERAHPQQRGVRYSLGKSTAAALAEAGLACAAPSCSAGPITEDLVRELHELRRRLGAEAR